MTAAPLAPRRRRPREETRRLILDAAFRLFSDNGFARTSVRDIAAAVGVTDAALYHHFASKKDLLDAVFDARGVGAWAEWTERAAGSLPLPRALERAAVAGLQFIEQHRGLFRLVLIESLAGDEAALAHHAGQMARWRHGIHALLTGSATPPADPHALANQLVATLWGIAVERLLGADPTPLIDPDGRPSPYCRDLVHGIVSRLRT